MIVYGIFTILGAILFPMAYHNLFYVWSSFTISKCLIGAIIGIMICSIRDLIIITVLNQVLKILTTQPFMNWFASVIGNIFETREIDRHLN